LAGGAANVNRDEWGTRVPYKHQGGTGVRPVNPTIPVPVGVNFINVLRTNFSYKRPFWQFFLDTFQLWRQNFVRKMLE